MAELLAKIDAFVALGTLFTDYVAFKKEHIDTYPTSNSMQAKLEDAIILSKHKNGWFTQENVLLALDSWGKLLTKDQITNWLNTYPTTTKEPKTVALIMAGNIPLVGFHDLFCCLLSGNKALLKLSSSDTALLTFVKYFLSDFDPFFKNKIEITEEKLSDFDAVIATGSNNTARYFEYYFGKKPNIIRKNRNSIGVLTGNESEEDLAALADDIFRYYGMGCRSVSKLFFPENFDVDRLFKAVFKYSSVLDHIKYTNNYDYNKAVYLMSQFKFLENGFLMLKEDSSYASPIGSLFFETYSDLEVLKLRLEKDKEQLQCIVGKGIVSNEIAFGQTQEPQLGDYADGVDTMSFLTNL